MYSNYMKQRTKIKYVLVLSLLIILLLIRQLFL